MYEKCDELLDQLVVKSLIESLSNLDKSPDTDLVNSIHKVLQHYMTNLDYIDFIRTKK